jgi:glycosyltransferase involved in cell wall biosynthesis
MRFAVDAHAIGRNLTGNETYIRSLLRAFAEVDGDSEFYAYVSEPAAAEWIPERFNVSHVSRNPFRRLGWDLARASRADKVDLLHVQYTAPLFSDIPTVVTVHDVSYIECPEYFELARRAQLRYTVGRTVERAARIVTVSEFSRQSILKAYDVAPNIVKVIPNAANPAFRIVNRDKALASAREKLGFAAPFIFSCGDLQPRKNQIGLIEAFARMLQAHPKLPHHLVLTGKETWFAPKVREAARTSGFGDRIHFTGFVPERRLLHLYNACDLFVFPSFYEGFGLPILEAMACGRAVACSDTSAMPEVADGAGVLFDPTQPEQIARAMSDILLEPAMRGRLERLGAERATFFNWQVSARATLDVYRDVVEERRTPRTKQAALAGAGRASSIEKR